MGSSQYHAQKAICKCAKHEMWNKKFLEMERAFLLFKELNLILCAAPSHTWDDFYSALPNSWILRIPPTESPILSPFHLILGSSLGHPTKKVLKITLWLCGICKQLLLACKTGQTPRENVLPTSEPARKRLQDKKWSANCSKIEHFKTKPWFECRWGVLRTPTHEAPLCRSAPVSRKARKTPAKIRQALNNFNNFIIYGQQDT